MTSAGPSAYLFQEDLYAFASPVLVILPRAWATYNEEDQSLLYKILTSVKTDARAIQIVVQPSVQLESLKIFSPLRVLIFGSQTTEELPVYQSIAAQGFTVIKADDLSTLDDQKKKNLWTALRQMFGL